MDRSKYCSAHDGWKNYPPPPPPPPPPPTPVTGGLFFQRQDLIIFLLRMKNGWYWIFISVQTTGKG